MHPEPTMKREMRKFFIDRFKKGKWLDKSNTILGDKKRMASLLEKLPIYLKKEGLKRVKEDLSLLREYISDIMHGHYTDYSKKALALAVAAIIYVISPLDIIPDIIPTGFLDDATIIAWAIAQLSMELEKYRMFHKGLQPTQAEAEEHQEESSSGEEDPYQMSSGSSGLS